ncbi:heme peroxidase [Artomyces pyxidatus]|uniref:Heme peroxidase n=1 Tax=Artomyces pyxidatus TaxID=48021 RepID=A0ACB8SVT9_9AGAM|nr:heme peroxidase [Artomyces pyxidatus]
MSPDHHSRFDFAPLLKHNGSSYTVPIVDERHAPVDVGSSHPVPSLLTRPAHEIVQELERSVGLDHGLPFHLTDLPGYINAVKNIGGGDIDDRKLLLEHILTLMARLPKGSPFAAKLQQFVISTLYKDLPHPPSGYLAIPPTSDSASANSVSYAFRSADGSDYNQLLPSLGKARSPYARSVPSQKCLNPSSLPSPELVFDTLLKRDKFEEHPGGISSLFFAFADLVIHSIFNTDSHDWTQNNVSSYLDLSPLYGSSQDEQDALRPKDGTGKIYPDVFADSRLLFMPPAVCALLVILSRNHNFIAEKILSINERGNLSNPPPSDKEQRLAQDDEIFQRARLVNTGFFMQIILGDYVGAILGLVRDGSSWRLDPLMNMRDMDHEVAPRGEGNVVSIEFNLLYRWHATLSESDTQWTTQQFTKLFDGQDPATVTIPQFIQAAHKYMIPDPDVKKWTFAGLQRDANGRFSDADLARILQNATDASASAFKARGTPAALRVIEVLSISQARSWGTCSLNEFRKFMGLQPYSSFEKWNSNQEIADAARALYHDIDNLELHVGLQAEEAKKAIPGSGLCPGYTISRAILSDAVALTRGDRFLTVDYTPFNLTTWGYQDCQVDDADGSYGGMLTKLLFRHLPDYYPAGSVYAHFPFMVPKTMEKYAGELPGDMAKKYTWSRPPVPVGPTAVAKSYAEVKHILADPTVFGSNVARRLNVLTRGVPLDSTPVRAVLSDSAQVKTATTALSSLTHSLIRKKALQSSTPNVKYVDIVRDVINVLPIHWLANDILGLPLKTDGNSKGVYDDHKLYAMFASVSNYIYHNAEPCNDWILREQGRQAADEATQYIKAHLYRLARGTASLAAFRDAVKHYVSGRNEHTDPFLTAVLAKTDHKDSDTALDKLARSLFAELVPTAAIFSHVLVHVVNFYLDDSRTAQRNAIIENAAANVAEGDHQVLRYVYEALRLDPPISSVTFTAQAPAVVGGVKVVKGQSVLASVIEADLDPAVFQNPQSLDHAREQQPLFGLDLKGLLATPLFERVVPRLLHEILSLPHLQRAADQSGQLSRFTQQLHGVPEELYINFHGQTTPFPTSLIVQVSACAL